MHHLSDQRNIDLKIPTNEKSQILQLSSIQVFDQFVLPVMTFIV